MFWKRGTSGRIFDPKFYERESTKSSVDDLILGRGDVSYRAAFTLRVAESQPHLTWRFEHDLYAHFPQLSFYDWCWKSEIGVERSSLLLPSVEACRKVCFQRVALESFFLSENFQVQKNFPSPNFEKKFQSPNSLE